MFTLKFPPFEPDKAAYNPRATDATLNVLPFADGWKPFPQLIVVSDALPAPCVGALLHRDSSGTVSVFAATQTNLYKLNGTSWDEVSKSTDAYSVPSGQGASFVAFGNYVFVNNLGGTPQKFLVGTDSAFSDNTNMPQAKYMWTAGNYVVCGNLSSSSNSIQWSGNNDGTFWTKGERGSDIQEIPDGAEVQGGVGDERGAVVALREKLAYMQAAPSSGLTFLISTGNPSRGIAAPRSLALIGPGDFVYLSEDGFFRGVQGIPIGGERVDSWFQDQVDPDYYSAVKAFVDPFEKVVWFQYRAATGNDNLLGWDWQLDRWCISNQAIQEGAALALSGETWSTIGNLFSSWADAGSVSWDSRLLKGGRPTFAAFTTSNELAFFSGTPQAATIDTGLAELFPGDRAFVQGARLVGDVGTFTARLGTTESHSDTATFGSSVSPASRSKYIGFRGSGRLVRAQIEILAGENWNECTGLHMDASREGGF